MAEWDYNEDIFEGMARGLWLAAYSSFAEQADDPEFPRARHGQDWDEVAPETPEIADEAALALAKLYVAANHVTLEELYGRATLANGQDEDDDDQAYMFGFYLSQMAIGSGVSWFDDHARFELQKPFFEVDFDGEYLTWSGGQGPLITNPAKKWWLFQWREGGYNTVYAADREEALRIARDKGAPRGAFGGLHVDESTLHETNIDEVNRWDRMYSSNPADPAEKVFVIGERVVITDPEDDSNVIAEGMVMRPSSRGWVGIEIDGEARVDDWPIERVWFADPKKNPRSVMTGPGWSSAREKLRSAAAKKNPRERAPCKVCGGRGSHKGAGHAYEPVITTPCEVCGGRGPHLGPGHEYVPTKENPRLFHHPEDPHALRPSAGARKTLRYPILPGPKHGPTPVIRRQAPKRKVKRNPDVTRCEGCGAVTHASELDDRELCATCAAATGLPHLRPSSESALQFPDVCKHCLRAIKKPALGGGYVDAVALSERCPSGGRHEPLAQRR